MYQTTYHGVHPSALSQEEWVEILSLHQKVFPFSSEVITHLIKERESLLLYREKKTNTLIGTIGCSFLSLNSFLILYMGNVVIDPAHQKNGLFLHGQYYYALKAMMRYPFRRKFVCGFAMTEESARWAKHFPIHWPKENTFTPEPMFHLMKGIAEKLVGKGGYTVEERKIFVQRLPLRQMLVLGPINARNATAGLFSLLKRSWQRRFL